MIIFVKALPMSDARKYYSRPFAEAMKSRRGADRKIRAGCTVVRLADSAMERRSSGGVDEVRTGGMIRA
ncbi:MAG TPA: hypothetical protein VLF18_16365, partial [Tahibacter sp.]|uniref:hypothetical protein n=1 Tax=Tahibacter sp. TaxID=2056211 RepID=UPI002C7A570F